MGFIAELRIVTNTALSQSTDRENISGHNEDGKLLCPTCGTQTLRRTSREGFMQRAIFARFGYFPWKCSGCHVIRLIKNRGMRHRRRKSSE